MFKVCGEELSLARIALRGCQFDLCFVHLERAHVLAQRNTVRHTCADAGLGAVLQAVGAAWQHWPGARQRLRADAGS